RHCGLTILDLDGVACTAYRNEHLPERTRNVEWVAHETVELGGRSFDALVLNHHLAHAAMIHAFPEAPDAVLDVCDGGGDFDVAHCTYRFQGGRIARLPNQAVHDVFSSRFYDIVSRHLYGRIMCEGKLMALAGLGKPRAEMTAYLRDHLAMFHQAPAEE